MTLKNLIVSVGMQVKFDRYDNTRITNSRFLATGSGAAISSWGNTVKEMQAGANHGFELCGAFTARLTLLPARSCCLQQDEDLIGWGCFGGKP